MFQAVTIDKISKWVGIDQQPIFIPTLAGKSTLQVSCHFITRYKFSGLAIKISTDYNIITADVWDYLCFMINRIPIEQREKPSFYRDYDGIIYQYRKYAPWVAAISRQYCETFGKTNS